jgi:thiamine biosynthesis lipoprotein
VPSLTIVGLFFCFFVTTSGTSGIANRSGVNLLLKRSSTKFFFKMFSYPNHTFVVCWIVAGFVVLPGSTNFCAQEQDRSPISIQGTTMGPIQYRVTIARPPATLSENEAAEAITEALETVNRLMSTYKADSDVSRFNRFESDDWFDVAPETAKVVARSLEISRLSDGAFDITCGPAVNRWRFGPEKSEDDFSIPSAREIEDLKAQVGYHNLEVRISPPALKKKNPNVAIDLSAIAKGYAVDLVAQSLSALGCEHFMVEVGGEVVVKGERPSGGNWRIGVEKPFELTQGEESEVLQLSNTALATSGDYRIYRAIGGKRYSHTIDPRTCWPVDNHVALATIIASDCMTADAVATAVMVLGADKGLELCNKLGLEALIKVRKDEFGDSYETFQTVGFPAYVNVKKHNDANGNAHGTQSILPVFIGALIVFVIAVLGMATGTIFGNRTIKGSCGGTVNSVTGESISDCGVCSNPAEDCTEKETSNT